jgi:hypothetical protein
MQTAPSFLDLRSCDTLGPMSFWPASPIEGTLALVACAAAFALIGPALLGVLGLGSTAVEGSGAVTPVDLERADVPAMVRFATLRELGFGLVGRQRETVWLFGPHWCWRSPWQWVAASDRRDCFAAIYRVVGSEPPLMGLLTRFGDDSVLWTCNADGEPDEGSVENYRIQRLPGADAATLLGEHRGAVAAHEGAGPIEHNGFEAARAAFAAALALQAEAGTFRAISWQMLGSFASLLALFAVGAVLTPAAVPPLDFMGVCVAVLVAALMVAINVRASMWTRRLASWWTGRRTG